MGTLAPSWRILLAVPPWQPRLGRSSCFWLVGDCVLYGGLVCHLDGEDHRYRPFANLDLDGWWFGPVKGRH
jgi:hypothetical protein